jgi:hypothetical protein
MAEKKTTYGSTTAPNRRHHPMARPQLAPRKIAKITPKK